MQIESLFPEVSQIVPEAPDLLVRSKTISVLQRFYRESKVWKGDSFAIVPAGSGSVVLQAVNGAYASEVCGVRNATSGLPLRETRESAMNALSMTWRVDVGQEPVRYIPNIDPNTVGLWPAPSSAFGIVVSRVLCPSASATDFHDWVDGKYRDKIVSGVAGMLKRMPNKPWKDLGDASILDAEFQSAISDARLSVSKESAKGVVIARTTGFEEL